MRRIGVTGTDTGVGKTTVACALLALLRDAGVQTAVMKPVETGVDPDGRTSDAHRLLALATSSHSLAMASPYRFAAPLAPLAAAEREGAVIDADELDAAFERLCVGADAVLVEGAGGLLVPVSPAVTMLDLFRRWSLELVVVAANRLGVLNHALLTDRAARAAGLDVAAIILVDPAEPDASTTGNGEMLARLTPAPVHRFPRLGDCDDARELASAAATAGLDVLFPDLLPTTPAP